MRPNIFQLALGVKVCCTLYLAVVVPPPLMEDGVSLYYDLFELSENELSRSLQLPKFHVGHVNKKILIFKFQ